MANRLKEKQSAELHCKEMELQGKTAIASLQQTKEELDKAKGLLVVEREDSSRNAATLHHQKELYMKLKSDTSEQLNMMAEQLRVERSNHDAYETQVQNTTLTCTVHAYNISCNVWCTCVYSAFF